MHNHTSWKSILIPLALLCVLVTLLYFNDSLGGLSASTVTQQSDNGEELSPQSNDELPSCTKDGDCSLPTSYCSRYGKCMLLIDPICDCTQPHVLHCREKSGNERYLFCRETCSTDFGKTICE